MNTIVKLNPELRVPDNLELRVPETAKSETNIGRAMSALCAYYREFLETDFKNVRLPKRRYALRDAKNSRIGIRIEEFSEFRSLIAGKLSRHSATVTVAPREYRADLSAGVRAGITSSIGSIDTTGLRSSALMIPEALRNKHKSTMDLDQALIDARHGLEIGMLRVVITPLMRLLQPILGTTDTDDDGMDAQLITYTQELVERLLDEVVDSLPVAVSDVLVKGDDSLFEQIARDLTDDGHVKLLLLDYFQHFAQADLFVDLREMIGSQMTIENTTIYLNVGEIEFNSYKFPLFYVPLDVEFKGSAIHIADQGVVYVNKPACDYVAGELTESTGCVVPNPVSERIFNLDDSPILSVIEKTLPKILTGLQCDGELDVTTPVTLSASGEGFRITNNLSLSLADRADEAIVNDYELLLSGLPADHPLSDGFKQLIESFLSENPTSIEAEIDKHWHDASVPERLVFESPLPLAEEQRKLMHAVRHANSQIILVEGPPGCGKSHSLAALAFDAIRAGESVLVLSDKKEALDVAESKLNAVFERVRDEEGPYVNPVLRLGRDAANYAQIVKSDSVRKIRLELQRFDASREAFEDAFEGLRTQLDDGVAQRIEAGLSLDLREVSAYFAKVDAYREFVPEIDDFSEEDARGIETLFRFLSLLEQYRLFFGRFLSNDSNNHGLKTLQRLAPAVRDVPDEVRELVLQWPNINLPRAGQLGDLQRELKQLRQPGLGYLLRGTQLKQATSTATEILGVKIKDVRTVLSELPALANLPSMLKDVLRGRALDETYYRALKACITAQVNLTPEDADLIEQYLELDHHRLRELGLPVSVSELLGVTELEHRKLSEFMELREAEAALADKFDALPDLDYLKLKRDYEDFSARKITKYIDERMVHFLEQRKNDARTLLDIINSKSKFPVDKFASLQEAFPIMIAGLRDYANFVPLEMGLFDLVIIDEASQVSIAQALPAILRSKKIVLMGDRQQFSNIKSVQASKALNTAYFDNVREAFSGLEEELDSTLSTRLKNLDVTKSVMDFGEMTSQFTISLRKHFRGYQELISFSDEHFYEDSLQVLKLRGKPISDVLEFVFSDNPDRVEDIRNANQWEAGVIIERLKALLELEEPPTVGVITPFREQQKYITDQIMEHDLAQEFIQRLKLAVFTADSCQGEERECIFYSMVATREHDRLDYIFPADLDAVSAADAQDKLKVQRLNVAFSRGQEKLVFLCSKPIDEFKGSARQVLQHYKRKLAGAKTRPSRSDTKLQSAIAGRLLEWLTSTPFFEEYQQSLEMVPQFPLGDYMKNIDPVYRHPEYKTDVLLSLRIGESVKQVIIEYDGFEEHCKRQGQTDSDVAQHYLLDRDVEREAVLESYGYSMVRINRFNMGHNPVAVLDKRLTDAFGLPESVEPVRDMPMETIAEEEYVEVELEGLDLDEIELELVDD